MIDIEAIKTLIINEIKLANDLASLNFHLFHIGLKLKMAY